MAAPIKGTKGNDLNIPGTNGKDKLQGKGGDDYLFGGKGDDDIDGGQGVDTAVYLGNFADYTLTFKGTGNDKLTITDNVATGPGGDEGTDNLKQVEFLKFADGFVDVRNSDVYLIDAEVDESAQKPGTEDVINGTGQPATGFNIVRDLSAGVELALKVKERFGSQSDILPNDANGYADGVLQFDVQDGPGNPPTNTRATWSFDFSIATGLNGATTGLSDFDFKMLVDVDKSAGIDYHVWELGAGGVGTANTHWTDTTAPGSPIIIGDDGGIPNKVTQNSENFGFVFIRNFIDDDSGTPGTQLYNFGPGQFDIVLQAFDPFGALVAENHIRVNVI